MGRFQRSPDVAIGLSGATVDDLTATNPFRVYGKR